VQFVVDLSLFFILYKVLTIVYVFDIMIIFVEYGLVDFISFIDFD